MKRRLSLPVLCLALCVAAWAGEVTFAGGDGSSFEKAIVVKGANEETGVKAEYAYLAQHFPGYRFSKQSLVQRVGRAYDVLEFSTPDGPHTIYFDITDFLGKL